MNKSKQTGKWEKIEGAVKGFFKWLLVSIGSIIYWTGLLFIFSIFLMNLWHTSWEEILHYGLALGGVTSLIYAGILLYRRFHV